MSVEAAEFDDEEFMTEDDYWTIYVWPTSKMTHDEFLNVLNKLEELDIGWETV